MTLRYAHLAPDHLQQASNLNPLDSGRNIFCNEFATDEKVTQIRA